MHSNIARQDGFGKGYGLIKVDRRSLQSFPVSPPATSSPGKFFTAHDMAHYRALQ
jgi:hypothetical protein